jgi:hypothetical protein
MQPPFFSEEASAAASVMYVACSASCAAPEGITLKDLPPDVVAHVSVSSQGLTLVRVRAQLEQLQGNVMR